MSNKPKSVGSGVVLGLPGIWVVLTWLCLAASAAEVHLPTLQTKHGNFTNVVITARTGTDILIRHDGGIRNVKIVEIEDSAALIALGLKSESLTVRESAPAPDATTLSNSPAAGALRWPPFDLASVTNKWRELSMHRPPAQTMAVILGAALVLYLFACYCLKLICQKAASDPGVLVWFPLLQAIPAFRAAGMSAWWFVALFIPLLNLAAHIVWCFKISSARGKSVWVAIALLLPVFNLFAFLFLAFSDARQATPGQGTQPMARPSRTNP